MTEDATFMREAIGLSRRGYPAPNPHVGCVIVQAGEIVGRGFHDHAGGPHAEVVALGEAGRKAKGADVYVTLEPCSHEGRTPPCTQALISAGVTRVFVSVRDPNPRAAGGIETLLERGIGVEVGLLSQEAEAVNEPFLTAMKRRRPFIVAKTAMSLDGRVALSNGQSKWITGEAARREGRLLRAACGAVLVGRNTVVKDEPRLTVREVEVINPPTRIVLDPNSALTGLEAIFDDEAPTLHVVKSPVHERQVRAPMEGGNIDLHELLTHFFDIGITSILVEGGPITLGHFFRARLVDRLELFLAPKVLGEGLTWVQSPVQDLSEAQAFGLQSSRELGEDLWLSYRPVA